jgi:7-cyano-7-deazaguanine reductase
MLQNTLEILLRANFVTDRKLPLGRETAYPNKYQPDLLFPIARSESRENFLSGELPFDGADIWNAWELTWLRPEGLPVVATAEIRIPADSPNLIESKSLKLYLNSFAMSHFDNARGVQQRIALDLGNCIGADISVQIQLLEESEFKAVSQLPGLCLDTLPATPTSWEADATLLKIDTGSSVEEDLHSHLLRSLCPVTGQPDIGSIAIHYSGPQIDHRSLLQYIVSFREHSDFHEACIERMFVDIQNRCRSEKLSIYARYQRRGGIDINPFRSNFQQSAPNLRLWRQ